MEKESKSNKNESLILLNINPSSFVTFVADIDDHDPESLYGKSLHCTNTVMVQSQKPNNISINEELTIISGLT